VREHELFVDVEANKYLSGGAFVGTGISLWDLTRNNYQFFAGVRVHF